MSAPEGVAQLVMRVWWPLRVSDLADYAATLQRVVGARCYLVGTDVQGALFDVVTYGEPLTEDDR